METDSAEEPLPVRRVTFPTGRNKETENEGPKPGRQTSVKLSLHPVWERLSLPHDQSDQEVVDFWSDQSHTMLYESPNFHPECAVYQDRRMPILKQSSMLLCNLCT